MPRIAHIAILAAEPAKLAEFYQNAFGFKEIARSGENGEAIYVSDGHINLALLPARNRREGIFHFGIQVEDVKGAAQAAARPSFLKTVASPRPLSSTRWAPASICRRAGKYNPFSRYEIAS